MQPASRLLALEVMELLPYSRLVQPQLLTLMVDLAASAVGPEVQTAQEGRIVLVVDVGSLALAGETIQVEEIHRASGIHTEGNPGSPGDQTAGWEVWDIDMEGNSVAD